ncbi:HupE/UreJ family protein [Celeribacter halophilus]|uniref:HupE/UreJ family protein n=1 Tax=Celeribacter halophilus TaxID=576117 RepID=UPI003A94D5DB
MEYLLNFRKALQPVVMLWLACVMALDFVTPAASHQMDPAVISALVQSDHVEITIRDALEPIIAISQVDPKSNADAERVNSLYRDLRTSDPVTLEEVLRQNWDVISANFHVYAGDTRLELSLDSVTVPEIGDPLQLRFSTLTMTAALPADDTPVRFSWRADFGPFSIHQAGGDGDGYTELLQGGQESQFMPRAAPVKQSASSLFVRFVVSGFEHIVPKGTDHILFVLGLFLFSLRIKPILAQVTAFTLAHSITLALASLNIVSLPASIVEPLIAVSIVYVALENILFANRGAISLARVAVVFGFGLLHGLGFASVLSDVGLPAGQFLIGLVGFNVGVELGQLSVICAALLMVGLPFGQKPWYRSYIVIPASAVIAVIGLWWAIERVFF